LSEQNFRDPAVAYNFENLEALCLDCHNEEHFNKRNRRWKINSADGFTIRAD
jgi:hypothetical protein